MTNNDESKKIYEEYINDYKNLSLFEKRTEVFYELKKMIALLNKVNTDIGLNNELLLNREVLEAIDENALENDYLEGLFVYVNCLEELLGTYLEHTTQNIYE